MNIVIDLFHQLVDSFKEEHPDFAMDVQENAPKILFGVSAVSTVGAAVTGFIAGFNAKDDYIEYKISVEEIKRCMATGQIDQQNGQKAINAAKVKGVLGVAKHTAAPIIFTATSIGAGAASQDMLDARISGLALAYAAKKDEVDKVYNRLEGLIGKEETDKFKYNLHKPSETVTTIKQVEDKNGKKKEKEEKTDYYKVEHTALSRIYNSDSKYYVGVASMDKDFLMRAQALARKTIRDRAEKSKESGGSGIGYYMLSEAYAATGFAVTEDSLILGWPYDINDPDRFPKISFGLFEKFDTPSTKFINEVESNFILDFNVVGDVFKLRSELKKGITDHSSGD